MRITNRIAKAGMSVILAASFGFGAMATFVIGATASPQVALAASTSNATNLKNAQVKARSMASQTQPTKTYREWFSDRILCLDMYSPKSDSFGKSAKPGMDKAYIPFGRYYVDVTNWNESKGSTIPSGRVRIKGTKNWKTCTDLKVKPDQTIEYQCRCTYGVYKRAGRRYGEVEDDEISRYASKWSTVRTWKNTTKKTVTVTVQHKCYYK